MSGTDLALPWQTLLGYADWSVADGDLLIGDGLEASVIVSLFSDRRLSDDATVPDGSTNRRGSWLDSYAQYWQPPGYQTVTPIGSRLWLFERAKKTGSTVLLRQAENYGNEALEWMPRLLIVTSVTCAASWYNATALALRVDIVEIDGNTRSYRFLHGG